MKKPIPMTSSSSVRLFSVIFFLSGATSLVYQVAWMRSLSLFFGSDVYSAAITLSAFMAGSNALMASTLGLRRLSSRSFLVPKTFAMA